MLICINGGLEGLKTENAEKKKIRLDQLSKKEINKFVKEVDINIPKMFDVVNSMNSKKSFGGTSTKNVKRMIIKYRKELK